MAELALSLQQQPRLFTDWSLLSCYGDIAGFAAAAPVAVAGLVVPV